MEFVVFVAACPINVPKPPSGYWRPPLDDEDEYGNPIQYRTKVIYVEKETPYYQRMQEQPDLTGVYWKRDFGTFQYVQGPF